MPKLQAKTSSHTIRRLCWDLENRPSAYWWDDKTSAEITAIGWKWEGEPNVRTLMLMPDGYFAADNDTRVPAALAYVIFRDELCKADVVYGHNIRRHDLPLFQAGLLRQGLPVLPSLMTTDTCRDYPKRKDMSVSLENLAALYGLPGEKFGMPQVKWEEANRLTPAGVALAKRRVVSDVLLQEALRKRLAEEKVLGPPRKWYP